MNTVVIFTILVGICFIICSFIFSEKLDDIKAEKETQKIILNEFDLNEEESVKLKDRVDELTSEYADEALVNLKKTLGEESNDKLMAISEFSQTVMEDIEKAHSEVVYLYNMLKDKEKDIKNYVQVSARTIVEEQKSNVKTEYEKIKKEAVVPEDLRQVNTQVETHLKEQMQELEEEPLFNDIEGQQELDEKKQQILTLAKEGESAVDIARKLDMGVGEVQLIIGLYQGGAE